MPLTHHCHAPSIFGPPPCVFPRPLCPLFLCPGPLISPAPSPSLSPLSSCLHTALDPSCPTFSLPHDLCCIGAGCQGAAADGTADAPHPVADAVGGRLRVLHQPGRRPGAAAQSPPVLPLLEGARGGCWHGIGKGWGRGGRDSCACLDGGRGKGERASHLAACDDTWCTR